MSKNIIALKNVRKSFYVSDCETIFDYLKLKNLRKKKEIVAIDDLSFDINEGEFVGLLGVNGAGKSTLIKMMTGIMVPTDGDVQVLGNDPFKKRIKNNYHIGAVFGQRCQLRWDIAPIESYRLYKEMYKIPADIYEKRLAELVNILEIEAFVNQPVRTLSLGQRMRAELVGAFLHKPKVMFLDEPTLGLDILSKEAIIRFLKELRTKRETTVIFTTHDMEDVGALCERVILINQGRKVLDDDIKNIEKYTKLYTIIKFGCNMETLNVPMELKQYEHDRTIDEISFKVNNEKEVAYVIEKMVLTKKVYKIEILKPEFKDIFKSLFNEGGLGSEDI